MIFGAVNEALDHCLACGKTINNFTWQTNNGVCDACPRLYAISESFWKVINHLALRGDLNAQETMRKYANPDNV